MYVCGGLVTPTFFFPVPQQVQDFRRNVLNVCETAVMERTSSDMSMVLYNYPPKLCAVGDIDEEEDLIDINVCCYSSDGKPLQTTLKVCVCG